MPRGEKSSQQSLEPRTSCWLLCRGASRVLRRSQIFPRQTGLGLAKQFTVYFQIYSSSKLLPLKIITSSKQINLNIPLVLEGVLWRSLNAPRERWAKLIGEPKLNFCLHCSRGMFVLHESLNKIINFCAVSSCINSCEIWPVSMGSKHVWCIIPCTEVNRLRLFPDLPCKSNKSLSLLFLSCSLRKEVFCKVNLGDSWCSGKTQKMPLPGQGGEKTQPLLITHTVIFTFKVLTKY